MSVIQWRTSKRSRWYISENACKYAYHYCLTYNEDGAPEQWRNRIRDAVAAAAPGALSGYLLRYVTEEGATVSDLVSDGMPKAAVPLISDGRRQVFYLIAQTL